VHRGQAGYHVLTPVKIGGGDTRILINRGWIPLGKSRTDLPVIQTPSGVVTITGLATVPLKGGFHLGPADRTDQPWYPVWQYLELERYQERVPFAIQPVVLLLDPDSQVGGFEREWQRLDTGIAVHQGYAFQWFSLAIALLIIVLFFNFRDAASKIVK